MIKEKLLSISKTLNIEKVLNKKPFISGGEKQSFFCKSTN